jgi:hypothetical protein
LQGRQHGDTIPIRGYPRLPREAAAETSRPHSQAGKGRHAAMNPDRPSSSSRRSSAGAGEQLLACIDKLSTRHAMAQTRLWVTPAPYDCLEQDVIGHCNPSTLLGAAGSMGPAQIDLPGETFVGDRKFAPQVSATSPRARRRRRNIAMSGDKATSSRASCGCTTLARAKWATGRIVEPRSVAQAVAMPSTQSGPWGE